MATCCSPLFSACTGGQGCSQEAPGGRLYRTQNEHLLWLFQCQRSGDVEKLARLWRHLQQDWSWLLRSKFSVCSINLNSVPEHLFASGGFERISHKWWAQYQKRLGIVQRWSSRMESCLSRLFWLILKHLEREAFTRIGSASRNKPTII